MTKARKAALAALGSALEPLSAAGVLAGALLPPAGWEQRCCVTGMVHPCNWQVATCNVERKHSTAQTWRLMSYHLPARPSPCSAGER